MSERNAISPEELRMFEEVRRRHEASQEGGVVYFIKDGEVIMGRVDSHRATPTPTLRYVSETFGSVTTSLGPDVVWSRNREDLERIIAERRAEKGVELIPAATSTALAVRSVAAVVIGGRRDPSLSELLSANELATPEFGGIDISHPQIAAANLLFKLANMIVLYGVEEMEAIVQESLIHPLLYLALQEEFDELFKRLKEMLGILQNTGLQVRQLRRQLEETLFAAAIAVVLQFLEEHAKEIRIAQIVYRYPEFAKRTAELEERRRREANRENRERKLRRWFLMPISVDEFGKIVAEAHEKYPESLDAAPEPPQVPDGTLERFIFHEKVKGPS